MKAGGCFASGSLFQQFQNLLHGLAAGRDGRVDLFLILFGLLLSGDPRLFLSRLLQHPEFFFLRLQRGIQFFDLLALSWEDVYDFERGRFRDHLTVIEQKTGKSRCIALNREAIHALTVYFPHHMGKYLFSNHRRDEKPISRFQAWRIVRGAAVELGLSGHIGCHSLRKT